MVKVSKNIDLLPFNTFGVNAKAKYMCSINSIDQLKEVMQSDVYHSEKHLILGGGSNILFTQDLDGLVMQIAITGIKKEKETDEHIWVKVASGEPWHRTVMHALSHHWGGIENLSLIPGTVGAAPIQNIGAYGVEIKKVIETVEAVELSSGKIKVFTHDECQFGYRNSVFKNELKGLFCILSITLKLTKKKHVFNIQYGVLAEVLKQWKEDITLQSISKAVVHIRRSKLPDPEQIGNAGSFFKNPRITSRHYTSLQQLDPDIPGYPVENEWVKVPAGWLIEQCGWKGKNIGRVGVHSDQALVLINHGGGTGKDVLNLAQAIQLSVWKKFKIDLIPEVTIL